MSFWFLLSDEFLRAIYWLSTRIIMYEMCSYSLHMNCSLVFKSSMLIIQHFLEHTNKEKLSYFLHFSCSLPSTIMLHMGTDCSRRSRSKIDSESSVNANKFASKEHITANRIFARPNEIDDKNPFLCRLIGVCESNDRTISISFIVPDSLGLHLQMIVVKKEGYKYD